MVLGDKIAAIPELRAAAAEDPEWPNARAMLATAELLEGNRDEAFEIAEAALAQNPTAHQAAMVIIQTAPSVASIAEIEARIPTTLRERVDVLLTLAHRARDSGEVASRQDLVARAANLFPNDWRVQAAQAELLLEWIFGQRGLAFTHAVPAARVPDLERAIALLQEAWAQILKRDNASMGVAVAANLLSALEVAGRTAEYGRLLTQALNIAPTSQPLLRRYAQAMATVDDWEAAANALDAIPAEFVEIPDRLFRVQASAHTGGAREAIGAAKSLELEIGTGRNAEIAAGLQVEAACVANCIDEVLPDILARWPNFIVLRSVAHNLLAEGDPRRAELLKEIKSLVRGVNDPGDRIHAAEALYDAKQYSAAADLYQGLYSLGKDAAALYRSLFCLLYADRRREARELFDLLELGREGDSTLRRCRRGNL